MARDSKRDQIRGEAVELLKRAGKPLHHSEIAKALLPALGLAGVMSPKDINTCLHDDPQHRFLRVGRGTWALATTPSLVKAP
jgi:HB1/ASXL restriction endonuclease-like protein with HTH domain